MHWKTSLFALALTVATACSSNTSKGISVNAKTAAAPAAGGSVTAQALDLGNGISIDRVRFVVKKVEVEGHAVTPAAPPTPAPGTPAPGTPAPGMGKLAHKDAGSGGGDGSGAGGEDGSGDDGELEFGPFLVDLAAADLTAGIHFQFALDVPNGTYEEVKFKLNNISAADAAAAPVEAQRAGLADLAARNASVVVNGTFKGTAFEFAANLEAEQENEGNVVVDANGAALTLNVDATKWFTAADGTTALDPADPANATAITRNIKASIRVENDEDHGDL